MKRSEMIEIMLVELSKNAFKTRKERYSTFEHILGKMEAAGMLPPTIVKIKSRLKPDFGMASDRRWDELRVNEWEKENE